MTTINDISDIARVLREHPEWRETIRGLVLGEEIARLPEQLAAFIDATQRNFEALGKSLDAFTVTTQQNFRLVYQRLDRLEEDQDRLRTGVNRLTGRVDNGLGTYYEYKADKAARRLADRYLDLLRVRVLQGAQTGFDNEFAELLDDARMTGLVSQDQFQEILQLDLVFAAKRNSDGADVHVAAEVSITTGDSDIVRAARRAALLADITGNPVMPAVISAHIDDGRKALAAQQGVTVMLLPEN
jgi:hypothetical protein